ncbi:hypothetical protein BRADI_1g13845v3 [Brachypodium distachyon]|uniref:Uncharacterized protein n=1 Tax=Brachypodium distachyon TaxID=15368 RepID=A0A2K2DJD1_BRADI|nr:hypothetical protein BRADI_1g13845v3 [Brachypodium distachyon]
MSKTRRCKLCGKVDSRTMRFWSMVWLAVATLPPPRVREDRSGATARCASSCRERTTGSASPSSSNPDASRRCSAPNARRL